MTMACRAVLSALVSQGSGQGYTYGLCQATGLPRGTVAPLMRRMEREGWVLSQWEDRESADAQGRPVRRYYQVTDIGRAMALSAGLVAD